ncbi:MAG: FecR domain-containing protein [Planctomycetota bacterium]
MKITDDYLWDRSGEPDPEVQKLERVMGSLRHRPEPETRRPSILQRVLTIVAAAAILILAFIFSFEPLDGDALISGTWIRTAEDQRSLQIPGLGELSLDPGTELQVQTMSNELARLYLMRGRLHAFIYPDVPERFFQVDTPSALCVDLGCKYELEVDDDGSAFVRVTLGQVAFENGERSVHIPSGAACRAHPEKGAGLPFFETSSSDLLQAVEAYDRANIAGADRMPIAESIFALATREKDSLTLFHMLMDEDARIAIAAQRRLAELIAPPPGIDAKQLESVPDDRIRSLWHAELELFWY